MGPLPLDVAPWVALGALILAVAPLLWAGAAKEVVAVTSAEMVDRSVPTTVTYVSLPGLAMSLRLPAPGGTATPPYGLLVRDSVASNALTIVATAADPLGLNARTVTARLQTRPYADRAAAVFAERGEVTGGLVAGPVLVEVVPSEDEAVQEVGATGDLAALPEGTLVRIALVFAGESAATCALSDGGCADRVLAAGGGVFIHLAHGADDAGAVLVQTLAPSSVVTGTWQGTQVRNDDELAEFAESLPVRALAGWGRILVVASVADDPHLVRDRAWLGPILLAFAAVLLWLGGRIGYPYFRPAVEGGRRWGVGGEAVNVAVAPPGELAVRVSGHALTTNGSRRHLDEEHAVLRATGTGGDGRVTAAIDLPGGVRIALAAHDTGILGRVERGEVVSIKGVQPALWAHWYGTNLRMTFSSTDDRDRAADLIGGDRRSVGSGG